MLIDRFFYVTQLESSQGSIACTIAINTDHGILKGHFPGQPVVPGVCMMQMIKEIFSFATGYEVRLLEGDNIKFMSVLDPTAHPNISATILYTQSGHEQAINATLFAGDLIFFKYKATYLHV